jgi:UDP-glucose 4,6-dehydratase
MDPTNPYAATKAAAEQLVKAYRRSFALPVIITRGNNVYGPHQYPEKIIPKFINQLIEGRLLTLHGTGENTRNYLYVEDVAAAFDVILHRGTVGEIYNIGGVNERSNKQVAHALLELFGFTSPEAKAERIRMTDDRPFNDLRYHLDTSRLKALGWTEKVSWDDGLARTKEWYGQHRDHWADVTAALVAHPRRGLAPSVVTKGVLEEDTSPRVRA